MHVWLPKPNVKIHTFRNDSYLAGLVNTMYVMTIWIRDKCAIIITLQVGQNKEIRIYKEITKKPTSTQTCGSFNGTDDLRILPRQKHSVHQHLRNKTLDICKVI